VPEIEAIRTERFYAYEEQGIQVVPSVRAANFTMNRKAIRDLAARELGLRTADYRYASSLEELEEAVAQVGLPCVVKPMMSSSGKGQSIVRSSEDIEKASSCFAREQARSFLPAMPESILSSAVRKMRSASREPISVYSANPLPAPIGAWLLRLSPESPTGMSMNCGRRLPNALRKSKLQ